MTDDEAQVIVCAIYDKKGFQMINTVHTDIVEESKERRIFDLSTGKPGKKMVPITNCQNLYNQIMGFVDLDDLLAWFYGCAPFSCHGRHLLRIVTARRCHRFHEFKYWVPVYIWIVRKRADQAFKAYTIRFNEEVASLQQEPTHLTRGEAARKAEVERKAECAASLRILRRRKISHFDFLEDIIGYNVILVCVALASPPSLHVRPSSLRMCKSTTRER